MITRAFIVKSSIDQLVYTHASSVALTRVWENVGTFDVRANITAASVSTIVLRRLHAPSCS